MSFRVFVLCIVSYRVLLCATPLRGVVHVAFCIASCFALWVTFCDLTVVLRFVFAVSHFAFCLAFCVVIRAHFVSSFAQYFALRRFVLH